MKLPDWRERLHGYLDDCSDQPFDWSGHSCVTFATGAVVAMTGIDYWEQEREIIASMNRRGDVLRYMTGYGGSLIGATARALKRAQAQPRVHPGEGDIVIADVDRTETAGVCLGRKSVFVGVDGLVYWRPTTIKAAWSVA